MIKIFQHKIKIENESITKLLKQNQKRGLFLYLYSLRAANERKFAWTNLKELMNLLHLKSVASNKKTLIESFKVLDSMNLVKVYDSYKCEQLVEWETINVNEMFYVKVVPVIVEEHYTLINDDVIDDIIFNDNLSNNEDALAIITLLLRMIESRAGVYKVCFPSLDSMIKELKIAKSRCIELLDELNSINIISCVKVQLMSESGSEKEHNIYSMSEHEDELEAFVKAVLVKGRLGKDLKIIPENTLLKNEMVVDFRYQHIWKNKDGEYQISELASTILERLEHYGASKEEVHNEYLYRHINDWCHYYDFGYLVDYIDDIYYQVGIENPIGYLIKMLPKHMEERFGKVS